jgi:hypothetical protein
MGINVRIQTEGGECLEELVDMRGYLLWALPYGAMENTSCIRFIDSYGDTVFNRLQIPTLLSELEWASTVLTEQGLLGAKQEYVTRAAHWPGGDQDARRHVDSYSFLDVKSFLEQTIELVKKADTPHLYVRFVGD